MSTNALLISGTSKTADIEQTLAYGIHGPKQRITVNIGVTSIAAKSLTDTPGNMIADRLFLTPPPPVPKRRKAAQEFYSAHSGDFINEDMAAHFLRQVFTTAKGNWAFAGNGKSGTSSMFRFLFKMEFNTKLSVSFEDPVDINPDAIVHKTKEHGVFRSLFVQARDLSEIAPERRFTLIRHPGKRATSAFAYFCKSDQDARQWMIRDRIWINALCGFDWEKDPMTPQGFVKFLEYIQMLLNQGLPHLVNSHWIPQVLNCTPAVYQPGIIGRLEEFDRFLQQVAQRLDYAAPAPETKHQQSNVQADYDRDLLLSDPAAQTLIKEIYLDDFELFDSA